MNVILSLTLVAAFTQAPPAPPAFKASANPVSDALRDFVGRYSKHLTQSAELMPADKYHFHPTPAQMTFGQLMAHVALTNVALCSAISGDAPVMPLEELRKLTDDTPKETLVAAVTKSFDACTQAAAKATDAQLAEQVSMFGRPSGRSRAATMVTIATDWTDHYSTAATYLRLNGILPPTAQPPK